MEKINKILIRLSLFLSLFLCFSQIIYGQDIDPLAPGGQDYEALKALYKATDGDNWINNTGWDFSGNVSVNNDWYGVTTENNRVIILKLSPILVGNNMIGFLPIELGNLSNLQILTLNDNQFSDTIPAELGNLSKLEYLYLSDNQLTGEIPVELGNLSKLTHLKLSDNQLTDTIPTELGNLSKLIYLDLSDNQLRGEIPVELGNLSKLTHLDLSDNQLTDTIPTELGNLSKLEYLYLSDNQLTGETPVELGQLSNLAQLQIDRNDLTGMIPLELGDLSKLESLSLLDNQLTGEIPLELGNLSKLEYLDLSDNQLTGEIPVEFSRLTELRSLFLLRNLLSGKIPHELTNLTKVLYLYYEDNLNLCEPQTVGFRDWLTTIEHVRNEGVLFCEIEKNILTGKVYNSSTNEGLSNFMVEVYPHGYYTQTDENGFYTVYIQEGNHTVTVKPKYPELIENLPEDYVFEVIGEEQIIQKDFAVEVLNKPLIKTDLGSTRRRRCFDATTSLSYENVGFAQAKNSKLTVTYPEFVNPVSSNPAWTSREGKTLIWDLGTIQDGENGKIYIQDSVICGIEEVRGLTQCTEIVASYDNRQLSEPILWDKSDIKLSAFCHSGNIKLTLKNQGEGDMNEVRKYRLYLDSEFHTEGEFQLSVNEEQIIEINPNGKTVRLEADQSNFHPQKSQPSITQEACGIGELSTSQNNFFAVSKGHVNELPMDDADEFREFDCMEITDSYDPNDKTAYPKGVTDNNYIADSQELEYRVRFQNTGSDTAYLVVVHDSLPEQVDISSLRMGASSHDYTWELKRNEDNGKMAIICTFKDIYLPHQKVDDAGSNGFFKFKIRQKSGNPKGTEINNQAFIYFDFNSAIITNETSNIVWDLPLTDPKFRIDENGNRKSTGKNNSETFENVNISVCRTDYPTEAKTDENIELCYDTDNIILKGNLPENGTGTWKLIDGSGDISTVSDTEIDVKNLGFGTHIFEWQISLCDSISTSQVQIHRKEPIETKNTAEKIEVCYNHEIVKFQNSGNAEDWKLISGAGKITQLSDNEIGIENLAEGSNIFQKTIGSCDSITTTKLEIFRNENLDFSIENQEDNLTTIEANSYQWFLDNSKIQGATSQEYFATKHGNYSVEIEKNGCVFYSKIFTHVLTNIESELNISDFRLYPNPTKNNVNIEFSSTEIGEINFKIIDVLGQEIQTISAEKTTRNFQKIISLNQLSKGIYYLKIQVGNRIGIQKIVKN